MNEFLQENKIFIMSLGLLLGLVVSSSWLSKIHDSKLTYQSVSDISTTTAQHIPSGAVSPSVHLPSETQIIIPVTTQKLKATSPAHHSIRIRSYEGESDD